MDAGRRASMAGMDKDCMYARYGGVWRANSRGTKRTAWDSVLPEPELPEPCDCSMRDMGRARACFSFLSDLWDESVLI